MKNPVTLVLIIAVILITAFCILQFHSKPAPAIVKPGKVDSSQTVNPITPTIAIKPRDSVHVRDSFVYHYRDSVRIKPGKKDSVIVDTFFHFYGISVKDKRGDSAFAEIGSASFPADKPADLKGHIDLYPAPDTTKSYKQVDTVYKSKNVIDWKSDGIIGLVVGTAIILIFHNH